MAEQNTPRVVLSDKVFDALVAAGVLHNDRNVSRVIIDLRVGDAAIIHVRYLGDTRLLEAVESLSGVEVHCDGGDEVAS